MMRPEKKPTEFGRRLRIARESLRLSRQQLAARSGIVWETIRNIELGYFRFSRASALAILRALATLDPDRAVYVSQGLETVANLIEELGLPMEKAEPPGPIRVILNVDAAANVTLQVDAQALGQLVAYAARCAREYADRPNRGALSLTLSLTPSVPPTGNDAET